MTFREFDVLEIKPSGKYSDYSLELGLDNFGSLLRFIQSLDYGRNSNKDDYFLVVEEKKGTCGTKHAFLYELIKEQNWHGWELVIGIYLIDCDNTPEACDLLEETELFEVPNAHTYLKYEGKIIDATKPGSDKLEFKSKLLSETKIDSHQINQFKTDLHRKFLKRWVGDNELGCSLSFHKVWNIREQIIELLSA
ncbi:MAG: hypothetical protein ABFR62_10490 [Bacteroidota bacterium]